MKYRDMTPEQKEAAKARLRKYRTEHREKFNARGRMRYSAHCDERKTYMKTRASEVVNNSGISIASIRVKSDQILLKTTKKLHGYEIHHCFTYDDPNKFIYIPRSLHLKIHQLLRDNNIPAESDHWNIIMDLVNSCDEYTYIRC